MKEIPVDPAKDIFAQALLGLGKAYLERYGLTADLEVVRVVEDEEALEKDNAAPAVSQGDSEGAKK